MPAEQIQRIKVPAFFAGTNSPQKREAYLTKAMRAHTPNERALSIKTGWFLTLLQYQAPTLTTDDFVTIVSTLMIASLWGGGQIVFLAILYPAFPKRCALDYSMRFPSQQGVPSSGD